MGGSNVTLKEGKQLSELKKRIFRNIYIQMEYLVTFLQNMSEEKEFKIKIQCSQSADRCRSAHAE